MKRFDAYMARYDREHTKLGTRLTHVVGIPMILVSLGTVWVNWRLGLGLFVLGWVLQFIGHRIEGNRPAFFGDPLYLLIGVVWAFKELLGWVLPKKSA